MLALALVAQVQAWYLPGMAPTDYAEGDPVPVLVNRLTSNFGRDRRGGPLMGLDYYDPLLRFCEPEGGKQSKGGSLGAILLGDRIYTSPITLNMLQEEECHFTCTTKYESKNVKFLARKIRQHYYQHWLIDGLPVSGRFDDTFWKYVRRDEEEKDSDSEQMENEWHENGFPLGYLDYNSESESPSTVLNNHFDITVDFHYNQATQKYRVVGASVSPRSIKRTGDAKTCESTRDGLELDLDTNEPVPVTFSYSVKWRTSKTPWATRWDHYLNLSWPRINWFALINTTVLVFSLCLFCILTLMRMLRKDIATYTNVNLGTDEIPDEIGWKLIAGDVFRPPVIPQLYAVLTGGGAQLLVTFIATVTLAALGLLSPANRGSFFTALLLLNTLFGGIGGYVSAVVYKTWGGRLWKTNLLLTPLLLPAIMFGLFFSMNVLLMLNDASGAVPVGSIVVLILIWGGISVPLSLICGVLGFKRQVPFPPNMRVNRIPRQTPPQPWFCKTWVMVLLGGIIPYLAVSLQLRYVLSAIWSYRLYYMFGFLFASIWAMVLLSAASSLLALYFTLVHEDYHWQWRAFCVAGSPALYIYLHACYYLFFNMSLTYWPGRILYIAYTSLVCVLCFLGLGSVGVISSYLLVRRIYESIKLE